MINRPYTAYINIFLSNILGVMIIVFVTTLQNVSANSGKFVNSNTSEFKYNKFLGIAAKFDSQSGDATNAVGGEINFNHYLSKHILINALLSGLNTNDENSGIKPIYNRVETKQTLVSLSIKRIFGNQAGPFIGLGMGYGILSQDATYLADSNEPVKFSSKSTFTPIYVGTGWLFNINKRMLVELGFNIDLAELKLSSPVTNNDTIKEIETVRNPKVRDELYHEYKNGINYTNFYISGSITLDIF